MTSLSIVSTFLSALLFAGSFFMASITDLRSGIIPNLCPLALLAAGVCSLAAGRTALPEALAGLLVIGAPTLLLSLRRDGMGGGDVKLIAAASFAVGLRPGTFALLIALTAALLFAVVRRVLTHQWSGTRLAPFLMTGYCLIYFCEV